jgi:hypothetical protein
MTEEARDALIVPDEFNDIHNAAMIKDLQDILEGAPAPDVIQPAEMAAWRRLAGRLARVGKSAMSAMQHRSALAEEIYDIQLEEDYLRLYNPDSRKVDEKTGEITWDYYQSWSEFREKLAKAVGIGVGTIGDYLKKVRYAREVTKLKPGEFAAQNGLVGFQHMIDVSSNHDGRLSGGMAANIRPKTVKFAEELQERYGELPYDELLTCYYHDDVKPDYDDPSAINKDQYELAAHAKDVTGAPDIWALELWRDNWPRFKVIVNYPDYESADGQEVVGSRDEYELTFNGSFVPVAVVDWVAKRLRARSKQ